MDFIQRVGLVLLLIGVAYHRTWQLSIYPFWTMVISLVVMAVGALMFILYEDEAE